MQRTRSSQLVGSTSCSLRARRHAAPPCRLAQHDFFSSHPQFFSHEVVGTSAQQINLHADPAHTHNRAAAFTSPPFSCCIASPQTIPKPHLIPRPAHRHAWQLCKSRGFEGCAELLSAAQHGQQSATASIAAEEVCPAPGCRSPSSTISKPLTAVQRRHFEEAKAVHGGWQGAGVVRTRRCSPTWFSDTAAATSLSCMVHPATAHSPPQAQLSRA
jgi:hypothetical protein